MNDPEFLIVQTPLGRGVTFLEASAGTGKTYTISKLVVRLIVEEGMPVHNILVMTFTEAATKELKTRIRQAIQETAEGMDDPNSQDLLAHHYRERADAFPKAQARLQEALMNFDEAAIFTIHGFCHRVLKDYAFESNQLFEPTLIKEPTPLWREAIQDFWRQEYYQGGAFVSSLLEWNQQTPERMLGKLQKLNQHADFEVLPPASGETYQNICEALKTLWKDLAAALVKEHEEIVRLLNQDFVFKKPLRVRIPALLETLSHDFPATPGHAWLDLIGQLTLSNLTSQRMVKHGDIAVDFSFTRHCEDFVRLMGQLSHQHTLYCWDRVKGSLRHKKQNDNLLTFDDLLPALLDALESPFGPRLQSRLQLQYSAVLVDEFQDTDARQSELFRRLFVTPDNFLFFIGDPKQAIYKFRGADIFSYLKARKLAKSFHTLSRNWRSDPALIEAVNDLFLRCSDPFLFSEIEFFRSTAALEPGDYLESGKTPQTPLHCCFLKSSQGGPVPNYQAKATINQAVVSEILKLLNGDNTLKDRPLSPADIAILTRSNREAHDIREELAASGMTSVIYSDMTVFETRDAEILQILLNTLVQPGRIEWLRALYASKWFDWSADKLRETNWTKQQERLYELHLTWENHGIGAALDQWISWTHAKQVMLSKQGGERRATNLLHMIELLGKAEFELQLKPLPLLQWFNQVIQNPDRERDDFLCRLESDENAVQIVTIHKSKGLQYPIVFIPFAWSSVFFAREEACFYHQKASGGRLVYDTRENPDAEDERQYQRESLSDAVRLLYVALTRAKHGCYLFWGDFKNQESSPIGHLMGLSHLQGKARFETPAGALEALKSERHPNLCFRDVEAMVRAESTPCFARESKEVLRARTIKRIPDRGFHITSFSSLASGFKEAIGDTLPEDEEDGGSELEPPETQNIFSLDRGRVTGNLIHDVLEQCDYQDEASVRNATRELGYKSLLKNSWIPIVEEHLVTVVQLPLPYRNTRFRLNEISQKQCLKEAEFHFPTRGTPIPDLLNLFRGISRESFNRELPGAGSWVEQKLQGYLRGFIDLLFQYDGRYFILDWKSNWLGNHPEDYDGRNMTGEMLHHAYLLQYYLYTVATIRYLRHRIPDFSYDRHFGGVYYLFVRGMHPDFPGNGVFFDRPTSQSVAELDNLFKHPGA